MKMFKQGENLAKVHSRNAEGLPSSTRTEERESFKELELSYNALIRTLFISPGMIGLLVKECMCVKTGTQRLDQIARIELATLLNKKKMSQERQKFIRRVNAIKRNKAKLKTYLRLKKTNILRSLITVKQEQIFQKIISLCLQHHVINKSIQRFRSVATEIINFKTRLNELERHKEPMKKKERRSIRSRLKQQQKFLGYSAEEIPSCLKRIESVENQILQAHDRMIKENMGRVMLIAKRYANRGLEMADLLEIGKRGLSNAVEKFNYRKDLMLSSYSTYWIKLAITGAITDSRIARIAAERQKKQAILDYSKIQRAYSRLIGKIEPLLQIFQLPLSSSKFTDSRNSKFIVDEMAVPPTHIIDVPSLRGKLEDVFSVLSKREKKVMWLRFGLSDGIPRTLEEIGQKIRVTRERTRQIEVAAIQKLNLPYLSLLGLDSEQAKLTLNQFIDSAQSSGVNKFLILHNKENAILRLMVGESLKDDKRIINFRLGDSLTMVNLK
jgi:RNA polymerase primary sigma factor